MTESGQYMSFPGVCAYHLPLTYSCLLLFFLSFEPSLDALAWYDEGANPLPEFHIVHVVLDYRHSLLVNRTVASIAPFARDD
mmetsp:Transcript_13531/g.17917  ORF Transcript_13531/g.17917 Transcript_13531/m.17917 type:complete len:82 (+) Transcript_13531:89-334(+)